MATANTSIQLKKSGSSGNTPVDLTHGEVAINYADGKLYYKNWLNSIDYISNQDTFGTVNVDGTLVIATTPTDVLSLIPGPGISLSGNSFTKSVTISSNETVTNTVTLNVNSQASLTAKSYTSGNTSQVTIDNFSSSSYRSAKYDIQITSSSEYHVMEVKVIHDDTTAFLTQYGEIFTGSRLGSFDVTISGGLVNLLYTPVNATSTVKLVRTIIST